jgi:hypothetical protein
MQAGRSGITQRTKLPPAPLAETIARMLDARLAARADRRPKKRERGFEVCCRQGGQPRHDRGKYA